MNMQNQTHERTVAVGWVRAIVLTATRAGVDEAQLLKQAGMSGLPSDPLARIGLDSVVLLWRAVLALSGDAALGLRMGRAIEPSSFSVLVYTMLSSATLRDAFSHLHRFLPLISDGGRIQLVEQNDRAWLVYHSQHANLPYTDIQIEAVLSCALNMLRWIVGADFQPTSICLTHAALNPMPVYRDILGCEPNFGREFNAIGLPAALLDAPLPARNAELCTMHERLADRQLLSLTNSVTTKMRLKAMLQQSLPLGTVQREQVATVLGMSSRALQQRLASEGTNFVETLDEVRHNLALTYMDDARLSLGQIAVLLNFSDASAFYRAFKRWTGRVPGDYRRDCGKPCMTQAANSGHAELRME
jgi:AraC-like DNA-binding protein